MGNICEEVSFPVLVNSPFDIYLFKVNNGTPEQCVKYVQSQLWRQQNDEEPMNQWGLPDVFNSVQLITLST